MSNNSNIKLGTIGNITVASNKGKRLFYKKTNKTDCYSILIERRNHKVKTDENKLFGTKQNHKYY